MMKDLVAAFRPFTWDLWLAIVVSFLVTGAAYKVLEQGQDDIPDGTGFRPVLYLAAASFTGGGGFSPKTRLGMLFTFSWTFAILLLASSYTANLASFFVSSSGTTDAIASL